MRESDLQRLSGECAFLYMASFIRFIKESLSKLLFTLCEQFI